MFWHFQDFLLLSLLANGNEKQLLANEKQNKKTVRQTEKKKFRQRKKKKG